VVWAALLLAQPLGGGLADVLANLAVALEHPFQIRWTEHSLVTILLCTGVL
jgi:type IV secretion system protein VirD4